MHLINKEIRFEVTNKCNARCIMCPREKMTRAQGVLDMNLYKRVLDEAISAGVTQVSLENFGEPLLDPYFFERTRYAKSRGLAVFTISNGSLVDERIAKEILDSGIDKIRFSMYAASRGTYEGIHKGLKYEVTKNNISRLLELKKKRGSLKPRIEMYFLLLDNNKTEAESFKKTWEARVDDLSIWKPHNWSDGRAYRDLKNRKKASCGRPFRGPIQVQWDGLAVPCCFDYNSSIVLGDLNKNTLHEILHSERYAALRDAHGRGEFGGFPFCDSCDQLIHMPEVLVYTTIKASKVGTSNTNYEVLNT